MKIVFLGAPGSGKSTVGKRLAADLKWQWLSTGEILRSSKEQWVQDRLKTAELFDDAMVTGLVVSRLTGVENAVIDGYPRTLKQAQLLVENKIEVDLMVEMNVPLEEAERRMLMRGREQDNKEVIAERHAEYAAREAEIVAYLMGNGVKLLRVDGVGAPDEVYQRAVKEILAIMKGVE